MEVVTRSRRRDLAVMPVGYTRSELSILSKGRRQDDTSTTRRRPSLALPRTASEGSAAGAVPPLYGFYASRFMYTMLHGFLSVLTEVVL